VIATTGDGTFSLAMQGIHGIVFGVRERQISLLVLLFAAALALRLCRLSNQSLWMDEISSVETARVPMNEIVARSAQNNALPTYFLLLRPIVGTTNEHIEVRARIISVVAGALAVPVFVGLVFRWYRHWPVALIAGILLAVNPLHLWYSQETRGYALMLLFGLCCLLCFELGRSKRLVRWWIAYIVFAILAPAVHKTGLVFPLACALWDGWAMSRRRVRIKDLAPHLVFLAIAALILIEPSQPPAREFGRPNSILEIAYTAMTFVGGYSFGPSLTDIQNEGPKTAVLNHLFQTGILAGVLALFAAVLTWRWHFVLKVRATLLLFLPVWVGFAGALLSNFPYNVRYTLPAIFGFLALLASLPLMVSKRWFCHTLIGMLLAINLWADVQWFFVSNYRKGDSRAVSQWLVDHQAEVKSWTVLPDYLAYSIKWYLKDHPEVVARAEPAKEVQTTSFPPVPDVLIIGRRHHVKDPDDIIAAFRAIGGQMQKIQFFAGFELYVREKK